MKVDLEKHGAPTLPAGYRYRVNVYEVYENRVDVQVSILQKYTRKLFGGRVKIPAEKVVGATTIPVPQENKSPFELIVTEAVHLYNDHLKSGVIN